MIDLSPLLASQDEKAGLDHGLNSDEYALLKQRLNRDPNLVELGIFSVMWSEHCSYKSSRRHLGKLPTAGKRVIQGPGENAGVIDIGDGDAIVFKMESHNHPSFIEPYQGAATGVGGILRDVFTMGARPIAVLNALRFGAPDHPKTRHLVSGVVAGIGGYGNCVGVPTVAGETNFHTGYNGNILVNAMAVGLAKADKIFYARGAKPGSPILYVGSKTGRDGIHGATMASAEFSEDAEEKRPTVQVGDPFTEKRLIEACLELMATDAIEAVQDMGAAGLTSSSVEMADKGGIGVYMDLDKVPQRETDMTAYEIMLSESQERMLMIMKPGRENEAMAIFDKWDLDAVVIGETTSTGHLVLDQQSQTVCDIPVAPLADDAPNYDRPYERPDMPQPVNLEQLPPLDGLDDYLIKIMSSPDMASKAWIYEQYDRHVMADTMDSSETTANAGIVRIHGTNKAVAVSSDCTPRYVYADPYEGGKQAVAESYRNISAAGAEPIAITDNLNFGNPERPDIMGQFVYAIEGMAEACAKLNYPVVSGNVSLYNETEGEAIPPTPVVGGVGLIRDSRKTAGLNQVKYRDALVLVGKMSGHLGQSLFLREVMGKEGKEAGLAPYVNLDDEKRHSDFIRALIERGHIHAAHDISDGGLLCAASEMALVNELGLELDLRAVWSLSEQHASARHFSQFGILSALFGEDQGRFLISCNADQLKEIDRLAQENAVGYAEIGYFRGGTIDIIASETESYSVSLPKLKLAHENGLKRFL